MILHIDMDAFYASVEQLDNPLLKGKCVIVGGLSDRSVVSAASYEARKFGIHSAMPMFKARQRCSRGIFVRPRMDRYKALSRQIMAMLKTFSPIVEPVSIDEAYVDITGCERLYGDPQKIAFDIKEKIKAAFQLTCSVGVAPNKFIAKIASDMNKPDGLTIIMPHQVPGFLEKLPLGRIPGVGRKRLEQLANMGIKTLLDVHRYPEETMINQLGKFGHRLLELAGGWDDTPVTVASRRKSISAEETLPQNINDKKQLGNYLLKQAVTIAKILRENRSKAKTITLKLKHADFKQVTRSATLPKPTQSSETIYMEASRLLDAYPIKTKIRLIGISASGLTADAMPVQIGLFEDIPKKSDGWEKIDKAVDGITRKYGKGIIKRGAFKNE